MYVYIVVLLFCSRILRSISVFKLQILSEFYIVVEIFSLKIQEIKY